MVAQSVQSRPLVAPSTEWNDVAQHRERIERWLAGDGEPRPLRLTKVHTLLVRDYDLRASYDTLWRFATQQLGWRKRTETVRVDDAPPGAGSADRFRRKWVDSSTPTTSKVRKLWVLIVTLCFSRYQFVWPTFHQTTEAVCEGLDRGWKFFGAMSERSHEVLRARIEITQGRSEGPVVGLGFAELSRARR